MMMCGAFCRLCHSAAGMRPVLDARAVWGVYGNAGELVAVSGASVVIGGV